MTDNIEIGANTNTEVLEGVSDAAAAADLESLVAPELLAQKTEPVKTPPENKEAGTPSPAVATPKGTEKQVQQESGVRPFADLEASLTARYGREIKLPEGTTKENLGERLEAMYAPKLHPDVLRIQREIDNGTPPEKALAQLGNSERLLNMSDVDLMRELYRGKYGKTDANPQGWDEAKVETVVKGLSEADLILKAQEQRDAIQQEKAARQSESAQYTGAQVQHRDPQWRNGYEKSLEEHFNKAVGSEERLYGLDLSKAGAKDQLLKIVKEGLMPDEKTGMGALARKLQADPQRMVRLVLLDAMADKGLINRALAERSQQAKDSVMNLLDTTPPSGRSVQDGAQGAADIDALAAPEGFVARS